MSKIGQPERATQDRVIALFRDQLGYRYLGDWQEREGNSNVEEGLLTEHLSGKGFIAHMDRLMPEWRQCRDELNRLPVPHEDWGY